MPEAKDGHIPATTHLPQPLLGLLQDVVSRARYLSGFNRLQYLVFNWQMDTKYARWRIVSVASFFGYFLFLWYAKLASSSPQGNANNLFFTESLFAKYHPVLYGLETTKGPRLLSALLSNRPPA
jgi:hypothetical protein